MSPPSEPAESTEPIEPAEPAEPAEPFIALERQVWEALVAGDPEADARALSADFVGIYPSGRSDRSAHCSQLRDGPTVRSYEIREPAILRLGDSLVLLHYLAVWVRSGAAGGPERMYVSSLWKRTGDEWLNVFSQDTPLR